jgi:hypothetical protein
MKTPEHETNQYAFFMLRVGATLVRKRDNASVYFQPGDDTARAESEAAHCFAHSDMYPGESVRVFNQWAGNYF